MSTRINPEELVQEMKEMSKEPSFFSKVKGLSTKAIATALLITTMSGATMYTQQVQANDSQVNQNISSQISEKNDLFNLDEIEPISDSYYATDNYEKAEAAAKEVLSNHTEAEQKDILMVGHNALMEDGEFPLSLSNVIEYFKESYEENANSEITSEAEYARSVVSEKILNIDNVPSSITNMIDNTVEPTLEVNQEMEDIKYAVDVIQSGFSLSQQGDVIATGYDLIKDKVSGTRNINDVLNATQDSYYSHLEVNDIKQRSLSLGDYAQNYSEKNGLDINEVPYYLASVAHTHFTHFVKLEGLEKQQVLVHGMELAEIRGIDITFEEEAVELSHKTFANEVYRNGGVWNNDVNDMTMDFSELSDSYNSVVSSNYSVNKLDKIENLKTLGVDYENGYTISKTLDIENESKSLDFGSEDTSQQKITKKSKSSSKNRI